MESKEVRALKELLNLCPYIGFTGGGISETDEWTEDHLILARRVNRIVSDALLDSGCYMDDNLKSKLYRYV